MRDFGVTVDRSIRPTHLSFAARFNVTLPFIDRHLAEGRGARIAIRTVDGDVTYAELAERVQRCGNALLALGLTRGDRMLMVVKDCAEFFYLFWGAYRVGIVPVPLNTLLTAGDYHYMIEDYACTAVVFLPEFAGAVEVALAGITPRPPWPAGGRRGPQPARPARRSAVQPGPGTCERRR